VYAFLQKALYSNLQGYQLFPRWSGTVGASYAF
ncbi:transporter, partial [Escherichia coli]|nr:transporter [Escherichia coli]